MSFVKFVAFVPGMVEDKEAWVDADEVRMVVAGSSIAGAVSQIYFKGSDVCLLVKANADDATTAIAAARSANVGAS